jgi:organic hydroperoxide reductase OsmC/OhrA
MARATHLSWTHLRCEVEGTLDRVDGVTRFTDFLLRAHLAVPAATSVDEAQRLLERVKGACLVSNSLKAPVRLEARVEAPEPLAARVA